MIPNNSNFGWGYQRTRVTVLKGHSIGKVKNHCSREKIEFYSFNFLFQALGVHTSLFSRVKRQGQRNTVWCCIPNERKMHPFT